MTDPIIVRVFLYGWVAIVGVVLLRDFVKWLTEELANLKETRPDENKVQHTNDAQPPPTVKKKPTALKPLVVHEGILLTSGFAKKLGVNSYMLEIQNDELGFSHEILGIDLKRALEASGARIGDRIRAALVGHVETLSIDGEASSARKIWDVTKID